MSIRGGGGNFLKLIEIYFCLCSAFQLISTFCHYYKQLIFVLQYRCGFMTKHVDRVCEMKKENKTLINYRNSMGNDCVVDIPSFMMFYEHSGKNYRIVSYLT